MSNPIENLIHSVPLVPLPLIPSHETPLDQLIRAFDPLYTIFETLPLAQKWGIFFGICVFTTTVSVVIYVLISSGTFTRMQEQSEDPNLLRTVHPAAPSNRPLLLTVLIDCRKTLISLQASDFPLSKMTLTNKVDTNCFKTLYKYAYESFVCPSSSSIPGHPSAPTEAYARAFSSAAAFYGHVDALALPDFLLEYARSYSRVYAAICTQESSPKIVTKFEKLYNSHSSALVGMYVHSYAFDSGNGDVVDKIVNALDGSAFDGENCYDVIDFWSFKQEVYVTSVESTIKSILSQSNNTSTNVIIDNKTMQPIGIITLANDQPVNLSIEIKSIIISPSFGNTMSHVEALFLVIDRIFSLGYRRILISLDSKDSSSIKFITKFGFKEEGLLRKDRIVNEASRDSSIFGLVNSDFKSSDSAVGVREKLFKVVYGDEAGKMDKGCRNHDVEEDAKTRYLKKEKESKEEKK